MKQKQELRERFKELDEAVWDADFDAAAAAYIRTRRSDLVRADPGTAALLPLH